MQQGLCLAVSERGENIDGLLLLRTLMQPTDGCGNTLKYDPEGSVAYVDFVFARHQRAMRGLVTAAIRRVGARPWVAWERRGELKTYLAARFVRHALKGETKTL